MGIGISVATLLRLEAGEPSVSLGVLATALWLVGRDQTLATLAKPKEDCGALRWQAQISRLRQGRESYVWVRLAKQWISSQRRPDCG
ncbi:hypothetical protein HC248_00090 [Polaromonas vacuolata]|uniref:HTH cro/C1-type domain-containing protein n=1 Tax=Polaromonas vacuolata TaxID=37448 RepID=A0A6H2H4P5_9BURK|nr:hypothetical protein [Polaromonas vacuolata]QJC54828.1 hypothetical protein HC248_00090 [Polaromonas vacuolata]